jgi:putative MATE family efflux protein
MADENVAKFVEGNLFRHVSVMSFTASIGLMAIFIVDFVDMLFISMLGVRELAAAVGYAGTILFFTTSISIGIAIATGAFTARALGAGDAEKAREDGTNVIILGVIVSAFVALIVWFALPLITGWVGAEGRTRDLAVSFLSILVPTLPVLVVAMAVGAMLRAHGDARSAMLTTVFGGAVNAVLDPIFIFTLDMGLQGAATASIFARFAIAISALYYLYKRHGGLSRPSWSSFIGHLSPSLKLAIPNMLTNIATPVGFAFVIRSMAEFGEAAVAGMAIVGRITPVAFAVVFALSGAIGPIIGQNFGAKKIDRVVEALKEGIRFTAAYTVAVSILLFLLRGYIADIFGAVGQTRALIYLFCGPLALTYFFNGGMFVANAAFNNLNHPFYSTWLNWARNTLGTVPFVYVGAIMLGAPGVLIGQAVGGIVFALVSAIFVRQVLRRAEEIAAKEDQHVEDRPFRHHRRLTELFARRH